MGNNLYTHIQYYYEKVPRLYLAIWSMVVSTIPIAIILVYIYYAEDDTFFEFVLGMPKGEFFWFFAIVSILSAGIWGFFLGDIKIRSRLAAAIIGLSISLLSLCTLLGIYTLVYFTKKSLGEMNFLLLLFFTIGYWLSISFFGVIFYGWVVALFGIIGSLILYAVVSKGNVSLSPVSKNNNKKIHDRLTRIKRWIKLHYYKIVRIDDPPDRIARGVAIGVFMGIFPTFGLGILFAIAAAYILKANRAAAVVGSFIMNPLTTPFFWAISSAVGAVILWEDKEVVMASVKNHHLLNGMGWAFLVYLVGALVVSTVFAALSYFITRKWVVEHRKHKAMKMLAKRDNIIGKGL